MKYYHLLKVLDRLTVQAKTNHRDATDYSMSNTTSFRAHWTRRISAAILLAVGAHLVHQAEQLAKGHWAPRRGRRGLPTVAAGAGEYRAPAAPTVNAFVLHAFGVRSAGAA